MNVLQGWLYAALLIACWVIGHICLQQLSVFAATKQLLPAPVCAQPVEIVDHNTTYLGCSTDVSLRACTAAIGPEARVTLQNGICQVQPHGMRNAWLFLLGLPMDLNTMTSDDLQMLRGIGPHLAQAIIAHRHEHGPYTHIDELLNVHGIGRATLAKIKLFVDVHKPFLQ